MLYLFLKYIHVIAAIFLFGFGMGSYLYLIAASRTGNPQVIAQVAGSVVRFDLWITTPAGFIQVATGYLLIRLAGLPMTTEWILMSLIIFFCVGSLWLPVLNLQKQLYAMASSAAETGGKLNDEYQSVYKKWFWLGIFGFLGMFVIVLIMVTKTTPMRLVELLVQ